MRMRRTLKVLVLFLIPLLTALPSMGQVSYDTATLLGSVLDAQGRAVPGARVTIRNTATGLTKSQESGADGTYTFPLLPVGTYQVEVTAPGFSRAVASNVVLSVGQALVQDMRLRLGETTATVTVTSEAPLLSVEQVQQANEITQSQVATLPNVNHTFDTYVLTLPGITNIYAIRNAGSQRAGAANVNSFTTSAGNGRGGLVTIDGGENDTGEGINPTYSPTFTQLPSGQQAYINALAADANASHCSPASSCAALAADLTAALNPSNSAVVRALVGAPGNFLGQPSQTGNFTNKDNWHDAVLRFDWQPNANDSFVLRGLLERRDNAGDYGALEYFQNATV